MSLERVSQSTQLQAKDKGVLGSAGGDVRERACHTGGVLPAPSLLTCQSPRVCPWALQSTGLPGRGPAAAPHFQRPSPTPGVETPPPKKLIPREGTASVSREDWVGFLIPESPAPWGLQHSLYMQGPPCKPAASCGCSCPQAPLVASPGLLWHSPKV